MTLNSLCERQSVDRFMWPISTTEIIYWNSRILPLSRYIRFIIDRFSFQILFKPQFSQNRSFRLYVTENATRCHTITSEQVTWFTRKIFTTTAHSHGQCHNEIFIQLFGNKFSNLRSFFRNLIKYNLKEERMTAWTHLSEKGSKMQPLNPLNFYKITENSSNLT